MKVAEVLKSFLKDVGVRWVFGVPGTDLVPLIRQVELDPFLFYVRVPNEQEMPAIGAGSYLKTGRVPAFFVAPPGFFNLMGSLPHLVELQIPAICVCGVPSTGRRPYLQDESLFPISGVAKPFLDVFRINPHGLSLQLERALEILSERRMVLFLVSFQVLESPVEAGFSGCEMGKIPLLRGDLKTFFRSFVDERRRSSRGAVVVGPCVQRFGAEEEASRIIESLGLPYVFTTAGPANIFVPGFAGLLGWAGYPDTVRFVEGLDYILSIGDRLGSISSSSMKLPRKVYAVCGDYSVDGAMCVSGDIKHILDGFSSFLEGSGEVFPPFDGDIPEVPEGGSYADEIRGMVEPLRFSQFFFRFLNSLREDKVYNIFVGHGQYLLELINIACSMRKDNVRYHTSIYYGWMGWAVSASIGYSMGGDEGEDVVCFIGDGTFYMHAQCLLTVKDFSLPVLIFVLNNGRYSMIDITYRGMYGESSPRSMATSGDDLVPSVAEGYGIPCVTVRDVGGCLDLLDRLGKGALEVPLVVDLVLDPEERPLLLR